MGTLFYCWILETLVSHSFLFSFKRSTIDLIQRANAYVSGVMEDLNIHGNQYNLLTTFFICEYLWAMFPLNYY